MAKEDTPSEALAKIMAQTKKALKEVVYGLHSNLIKVAPVLTGHFKLSWKVKELDPQHFIISNNAPYARVLWNGRMKINGRMYGSEQWSKGGDIMLAKANIVLQNKLNSIKE